MKHILEINKISKYYDDFALKNVNLRLPEGAIMGLIGENGAGKTTLIKTILGITNYQSGEIKIFGRSHASKDLREDIGVVLDDSFLSEYLNPHELNTIMRNFYTNWDDVLYSQYLETFQLPPKQSFKEFSSGMKMKLKIAVALAHHSKLLILDEPTSGLDPVARTELLDIFQEFIQDETHAILLSSHITSDLEYIADYITFINAGEIIFTKTRDELLDNYGIVKCSQTDFRKMHPKDYLKYRKHRYNYELLVDDKAAFQQKYHLQVIDQPTIENIMLLYIKGETK